MLNLVGNLKTGFLLMLLMIPVVYLWWEEYAYYAIFEEPGRKKHFYAIFKEQSGYDDCRKQSLCQAIIMPGHGI